MASKFKQLHLQQSVFIWFTGVKIRVLREHNFVDSDNLSLFVCLSAKYKLLSKVPQMSNHSKFHQLRALCLNDTIRFEPSFVAQRHLWIRNPTPHPPFPRPTCCKQKEKKKLMAPIS
jgi:hypothetical protein